MKEKRKEIQRLTIRSDIQSILIVTEKQTGDDVDHLNNYFAKTTAREEHNQILCEEQEINDKVVDYSTTVTNILKKCDTYIKDNDDIIEIIIDNDKELKALRRENYNLMSNREDVN